MPELPDLQVFSRNLSKKLAGKTVKKIHATNKKKLKVPERELKKAIEGARLSAVRRDGKELHFEFDNGHVLGLHLMLRGRLNLFKLRNNSKFSIIELLFNDGTGLAMTDYQRQATATLDPAKKEAEDAASKKVNHTFLKERFAQSRAAIKNFLLDQKVLRGIGSAYADEILWQAGISPFSKANKIPDSKVKELAKAIKTVLTKAEKSIIKSDPDIISGEVRDFLNIHNSNKTESPRGEKIRVRKSGARKTYYTDEQQLFS